MPLIRTRRFLGAGIAGILLCLLALTFALPQTAHAADSLAFKGIVSDKSTHLPLGGANVTLYDEDGNVIEWLVTGSDGWFEFYAPAGTYGIGVEEDSGRFVSDIVFGLVSDGSRAQFLDLEMVRIPTAFKGAVTDSVTGKPIMDAIVSAYDPSTDYVYETVTMEDGTYEIYAPAATYELEVSRGTYAGTSTVGMVFGGIAAITKDFQLVKYPLAFEGTITDSVTGLPLAGVSVAVYDGEDVPFEESYSESNGSYQVFAPAGTYDIEVLADDAYHDIWVDAVAFNGTTAVVKNFALVPPMVTRVAGRNRYETAANLARKGWDPAGDRSWPDVTDIIIANGENGREADPFAAAGLAGAYDAPLLLTQGSALPASTKKVIAEIALKNRGVRIHLIGGTAVVPDARWSNIKAIPGVSGIKDRVWGSDRYKTSAEIAKAMVRIVGAENIGGFILIAGDNPASFYDALVVSPISYVNQMPMLAVKKGSIPASVNSVLNTPSLRGLPRYVASSSAYIGSIPAKDAIRLPTSADRSTAAARIADFAIEKGWLGEQDTALVSSLPDALTGGVFQGHNYGVLLYTTSRESIEWASKLFIEDHAGLILDGWVIGGTTAIPTTQETTFRNLIK